MSGPTLVFLSGDIFGGSEVDLMLIDGTIGIMALYVDPLIEDSDVFPLFIGGRLNVKEKNCAEPRVGYPRAPASPKLVSTRSRVP